MAVVVETSRAEGEGGALQVQSVHADAGWEEKARVAGEGQNDSIFYETNCKTYVFHSMKPQRSEMLNLCIQVRNAAITGMKKARNSIYIR
jgi:hypothetical protein